MESPRQVKEALSSWARMEGLTVDEQGYVASISENLFLPLSPATLKDFSRGRGSELGNQGARGKMQALHSSSALACNVFEYWRQRNDRRPLEQALGLGSSIESLRFEAQFGMGLRGAKPNLDVVLETGENIIGIESKFLEPYASDEGYARFSGSYFAGERKLWSDLGLPGCQKLAAAVKEGEMVFRRLDVPQLLKHALGLWRADRDRAALWYIFFRLDGPLGEEHYQEVARVTQLVGPELRFRAHSYQSLIARLEQDGDAGLHQGYLLYLRNRYARRSMPAEPRVRPT